MKKLQMIIMVTFLYLLALVSCSMPISHEIAKLEAGMPNTVTLSNGEVVYNLTGEWNSLIETYGNVGWTGNTRNIIEITQTDNHLVGVLMKDDQWYSKGLKFITAELYRSGFKKFEILTNFGSKSGTGKISDDGNKVIINAENRKLTLTRK